MADFFWFSDGQWARIAPLLPTDTRGMDRVDDRRVLSGIVHVLQSGGRWSDAPREIYGPKKTLYNRFVRWAEQGIWTGIFAALAGDEESPDRLFIDSSCIKAHRIAGGKKGGLGQWYRQDAWGTQHQAPRRLRSQGAPVRPPADRRQCP
jgi:mannitol 2-dehydrogenase